MDAGTICASLADWFVLPFYCYRKRARAFPNGRVCQSGTLYMSTGILVWLPSLSRRQSSPSACTLELEFQKEVAAFSGHRQLGM